MNLLIQDDTLNWNPGKDVFINPSLYLLEKAIIHVVYKISPTTGII